MDKKIFIPVLGLAVIALLGNIQRRHANVKTRHLNNDTQSLSPERIIQGFDPSLYDSHRSSKINEFRRECLFTKNTSDVDNETTLTFSQVCLEHLTTKRQILEKDLQTTLTNHTRTKNDTAHLTTKLSEIEKELKFLQMEWELLRMENRFLAADYLESKNKIAEIAEENLYLELEETHVKETLEKLKREWAHGDYVTDKLQYQVDELLAEQSIVTEKVQKLSEKLLITINNMERLEMMRRSTNDKVQLVEADIENSEFQFQDAKEDLNDLKLQSWWQELKILQLQETIAIIDEALYQHQYLSFKGYISSNLS